MAARKSTSSSGSKGRAKVKKVIHEYKHNKLESGRSGKKVKSRKQAVAIALNEAREAGARIPRKKTAGRKTTGRKTAARKTTARKTARGKKAA
jgi:hypothetical protein